MIIGEPIMLGGSGESASIFVTGLTETDTVTATKDGKSWNGVWSDKPILPSGYTEIEYIEANGKEYILTNFKANVSTRFKGKFYATKTESDSDSVSATFFGARTHWSGDDIFQLATYTRGCFAVGTTGVTTCTNLFSIQTVFEAEYKADNKIYINDVAKYTFNQNAFTTPHNICIFGLYESTIKEKIYGRIYYLKFYDTSNNTIAEFIPCKNSSNEYGLYDLVSRTFYGNVSGEGAFTGGQEVHHYGHLISKLKSYGTYTVTAERSGTTISESVLVDMATEYDIEMSYKLWLYKLGDECEDVTGGWTTNTGYGSFTKNATNMIIQPSNTGGNKVTTTSNAITPTNYTYVCFDVSINIASYRCHFGFTGSAGSVGTISPIISISTSGSQIVRVPIGANPLSYPVVSFDATNTSNKCTIYKVWLE